MKLVPNGGNDVVYTPAGLAEAIVKHYKPTGKILEPCRDNGAFSNLLPDCDWCEITEGRDFLTHTGKYDWIITNPPWSLLRAFLMLSMSMSDNVVFYVLYPRCSNEPNSGT